jgi:benzodiazapine receptor
LSGLATIIPLGAFDQGEVSALYPTLFTPAVFTFSIWSIIYLSWVVI